jgi:hypothetical protein
MLSGKSADTILIIFGVTPPELELSIYHTRGEYANNYTYNPGVFLVM